jgi:predicted fused transcriptional regulator/phosphomethylpyrimidine kinase
MSIISPTWSGQDIKQVLGRIHRAGSQTPAIQKIVYCAKTYEDKLLEIINQKIKNIDAINDKDLISSKFELLDMVENPNNDEQKFIKK